MDHPTTFPLFQAPWYHNTPTKPTQPLSPPAQAGLNLKRLLARSQDSHRRASVTSTTTLTSTTSSRQASNTLAQALLNNLSRAFSSRRSSATPPTSRRSSATPPTSRRSSAFSTTPTLVDSDTSSTTTTTRPSTPFPPSKEQQQHEDHLASLWQADALIRSYVLEHWEHHADYITVDCPLTLPELVAIGRMDREEGVRECRGLVRVPVVWEEVGAGLWEFLVGYVKEGGGEDGKEDVEAEDEKRVEEKKDGEWVGKWTDTSFAASSTRESADDKSTRRTHRLKTLLARCQHRLHHHHPRAQQQQQQQHAPRPPARCPFCSGPCADSCAPEPPTATAQAGDGFWQREELRVTAEGSTRAEEGRDGARGRDGRRWGAWKALRGRCWF